MKHSMLAPFRHGRPERCTAIPGQAFAPVTALRAVPDERCTALYGVPTMFIPELDHPHFRALRLRTPPRRRSSASDPSPA